MKFGISFLLFLLFYISSPRCLTTNISVRTIAFYNVENLFDTIDNPNTFDEDFTPSGKNHYTSNIYNQKINQISNVISQIGVPYAKTAPALIGLAEIENSTILDQLANSENLQPYQYRFIHFDSPDTRGIDVGLLYQQNVFKPVEQQALEVKIWNEEGQRIYTRDVLYVSGMLDDNLLHIFVCHWPSRRRGKLKSQFKREKAAYVVRQQIDQILEEDPRANIIVMGDFNDNPKDKSLANGLSTVGKVSKLNSKNLYNPMQKLYYNGYNTLVYRDQIYLFDQILVNQNLCNNEGLTFLNASIYNPKSLIQQNGRFKGYPYRSFSNNQYTGGYSDHFPVYIYLTKSN